MKNRHHANLLFTFFLSTGLVFVFTIITWCKWRKQQHDRINCDNSSVTDLSVNLI